MAILIFHTSDKIKKEPYDKVFFDHGPVFYGVHDEKKVFFLDGNSINFFATRPSQMKKSGIIEYSETYNKDTEDIYNKARKELFEDYCYFLTRVEESSLGGVHDYLYYFRIHVKAAIRFLDENHIKFIFNGPPGSGFDNVLCFIAKEMGIDYVGVCQFHNNNFFWVKNWNDIGTYSSSLPIFSSQNIQVQKKLHVPFYMSRVRKTQSEKKFFFYIFKKHVSQLKDLIKPIYYAKNFCKMIIKYNFSKTTFVPPDWLYIGNKSRFLAFKYIQKTSSLLRSQLEKKDLPKKNKSIKILLCLKHQAEVTEAFSDSYRYDQLLMVDKLQNISDSNPEIYIKEHSSADSMDPMARANFWNSISKKENIFVLPADNKASNLIENFDIVASIDGTIGWEAIRSLKPVISFGKPWYLSMPGVFEAKKVISLEEILKKRWSLKDINETFVRLTKKMGKGYVVHVDKDHSYVNACDEFTNYENLTEEEKIKRLSNNDQVVADSFYKIYSNTYLSRKI
jgi:hypothetical protein